MGPGGGGAGTSLGGGSGNLEGLLQLRELEPLLELLLALQAQGGGAGGGLAGGGLAALGGGDAGFLASLQDLGDGFEGILPERERRILPALLLLALVRDDEKVGDG